MTTALLRVICIFCLHHALHKIHMWKLFAYGKIFAHGEIKIGRKSGKKIAKEERKSIILSRKEKKSLVKAIGTGGAPR